MSFFSQTKEKIKALEIGDKIKEKFKKTKEPGQTNS